MPLTISVALATFNGQSHLAQQLDSLSRQRRLPDQLVVSDDASADATLSVVREFAKSAPFDVVILAGQERLGFSGNFLRAIEACSGDYIALCDQDDVWSPDKLLICEQIIVRSQADVLRHNSAVVDGDLRPKGYSSQKLRQKTMPPLTHDPFNEGFGHSIVFSARLKPAIALRVRPAQPGKNDLLAHDHWITQIGALFGRTVQTPVDLVDYRQHHKNVFGISDNKKERSDDAYFFADVQVYRQRVKFYEELRESAPQIGRALGAPAGLIARVETALAQRGRWYAARARLGSSTNVRSRWSAMCAEVSAFLRGTGLPLRVSLFSLAKDLLLSALPRGPVWPR